MHRPLLPGRWFLTIAKHHVRRCRNFRERARACAASGPACLAPAPGGARPWPAHAPGGGRGVAGGGRGGGRGTESPARLPRAVFQPERQGWRRHRGPAGADERALQVHRGRWRHPGADRARARRAPAFGHAGPAQGVGDRVRVDGNCQVWRHAVSRTPEFPAWAGGGADALHPGALVGAKRARAPGAAKPERFFSRAAEAFGLGAAEFVPGAHPGPRTDRGHRAPGGVQRA